MQRRTKKRAAELVSRKNDEAYELDITADILVAVGWHVARGYAGTEFLFSETGAFPRYIDSHVSPLKLVQEKLGLRLLRDREWLTRSIGRDFVGCLCENLQAKHS